MSYNLKKLQVTGGGFNLNPPVDVVPVNQALLLQNFRLDRTGQYFSRYGFPQKFSIPGAGNAMCAGLEGGIEGNWYIGTTDAAHSLFYNFQTPAIATGFDGNRIAMVYQNSRMWVMNQALQGYHNQVEGWQPWNLTAPGASCTAAAIPAAASVAVIASVAYQFTTNKTGYNHFIVIAGTEYSWVQNNTVNIAGVTGQIPVLGGGIALRIALLAAKDPNCTVTCNSLANTGTGVLVITPISQTTVIAVSGSDGNPSVNLGATSTPTLPNGTYQWYVTFQSSDFTLESNPGPVSNSLLLANQSAQLTAVPVSTDARVGSRNIYRDGGTLGQAYLVGNIPDNTTTTFTDSMTDLTATDNGNVMPGSTPTTFNDPPPPAAGMCGPYFARLMAWNSLANPNRIWWTNPDLPQYWPGSASTSATGNWVDVGNDGEQIIWCSMHTGVLVIYKERSVWELVGDPDTGYLQELSSEIGLVSPFALAPAGTLDYFVGPNGLYRNNLDRIDDITGDLRPLFSNNLTNAGALTPPGSILPGPNYLANTLDSYSIALGYAMDKLYISYLEKGGPASGCLLVRPGGHAGTEWSYYRTGMAVAPFQAFVFDGVLMCGLTGTGAAAQGYNLDDFRGFYNADTGGLPIVSVFQSHYENAGLPDNQKVWLECVIDIELHGDVATVYVGAENGLLPLTKVGSIGGTGRQSIGFPLALGPVTAVSTSTSGGGSSAAGPTIPGVIQVRNPESTTQTDLLARNLSVAILVNGLNQVIIHNVYLYYYEEARLAMSASSIPTDLGVGKVKQCQELELDIDASNGAVQVQVLSDLPGNALAVRQSPVVFAGGRAIWRYPFIQTVPTVPPAYTEGYLWRLQFTAVAGPFRLYSARLLMRVVGVYVEAYESAAGWIYDTMEHTFESLLTKIPRTFAIALAAIPIKRFREISLEIETFGGAVTVNFLTDLPGDQQASRFKTTVNTGTSGRRFYRIPLPSGDPTDTSAVFVEGRLCRMQFSGTAKYILYMAAVELLPIGVYIEAYEAAGGAIYDSREYDFNSPNVKECTELELDIESTGAITPQLYTDVVSPPALAVVNTGNLRQKVLIPLTVNAATGQYAEGRFPRLCLTGVNAFRLYGARLKMRAFGQYLLAAETSAGALWDSTVLDLGTPTVKQLRELQLDLWAYGAYTVTVYTDLPGNVMVARVTRVEAATNGRTNVMVPLPQGQVPPNYIFGRLVRVTITSAASFKLFGARIDMRPIGCYVETYEAAGGAVWDSTPSDLGDPQHKYFDEVRVELDTDGAVNVAVYTDLPSESLVLRDTEALTTTATGRHWASAPLPAGTATVWGLEGRSIQLIISSTMGFRLYKVQVRSAKTGRYLAAQLPGESLVDQLRTHSFDISSERSKQIKSVEIDLIADGVVTVNIYTSQGDKNTLQYTHTVGPTAGRLTFRFNVPPGLRGRLFRISLGSPAAARVFNLKVLTRLLNEADAKWEWIVYPMESYQTVPVWSDFPIAPTPPTFSMAPLVVSPTETEWKWLPFPVNPTPPGSAATDPAEWQWGKFMSVDPTPEELTFIDVPFTVSGS